jgi:protein ImuB
MERERTYLCAYFPEWSTQVTRRKLLLKDSGRSSAKGHSGPIILAGTGKDELAVRRCCQLAARAGVRIGMPLPLARAMAPGAFVETFDPVRDCRALYTLATWCLRFSPLVALDEALFNARSAGLLSEVGPLHYGITLDLTGTERLHGDAASFAASFRALLGGAAHIAVAPTIGAAWALSRYGAPSVPATVRLRQQIPRAISLLPVQALRIDERSAALLSDVGVTQIGQLLNLPRLSLSQRFGKFLLYRLEQALGAIEERLHTVTPPRTYRSRRTFEPPLSSRKSVIVAINHLFADLLAQLKRRGKRAKIFFLTIHDCTGESSTKEFPLAAATDDISHLAAVIEPIVEGMNFFGEVRDVALRAEQVEEASSEQRSLSPSRDSATSRSRAELMNAFSVRLGKARVSVATLTRSYIPERSFGYVSAIDTAGPAALHEPIVPYSLRERPSLLLPLPEPVQTIAMLPDKPPSFLHWRGKKLKIITGIGPERIAPEWWAPSESRSNFAERDYFKVQDDSGRWLWVYRDQGSLEWFLHGVWA